MNYNNILYNSGPVKYSDYISNKYDLVHYDLYNNALNKYLTAYIEDIIHNKIIYYLFYCLNRYPVDELYINPDNIGLLDNDFVYDENNDIIQQVFNILLLDEFYEYYFINEETLCLPIIDTFTELSIENNEVLQKKAILNILTHILYIIEILKNNVSNISQIGNISDFILKYKEVYYIFGEDNKTNFHLENDENNILIYEDTDRADIHIYYNQSGKIILDIDSENEDINIDDIYDDLSYELSKSNYNILYSCFNDLIDNYKKTHKIIEIKKPEFYLPSEIFIIDTKYPHTKKKVDLTPYWSDYYEYQNSKSFIDIKTKDEPINDAIITDINYIQGTVKLYSKQNDEYYKVKFSKINKDYELDDNLLKDSFGEKLRKLEYENSHYE